MSPTVCTFMCNGHLNSTFFRKKFRPNKTHGILTFRLINVLCIFSGKFHGSIYFLIVFVQCQLKLLKIMLEISPTKRKHINYCTNMSEILVK